MSGWGFPAPLVFAMLHSNKTSPKNEFYLHGLFFECMTWATELLTLDEQPVLKKELESLQ